MKRALVLAALFATTQAWASEKHGPKIDGIYIGSSSRWCQPSHTDRFTQWTTRAKFDSAKGKVIYFDRGVVGIGDTWPAEFAHIIFSKGARSEPFAVTGDHSMTIGGSPGYFTEFGLDESGNVSTFTLLYPSAAKTCTTQEIYNRVSNRDR